MFESLCGQTNGQTDMFPPRAWSLDWLTRHCEARFGVAPSPTRLVDACATPRIPNRGRPALCGCRLPCMNAFRGRRLPPASKALGVAGRTAACSRLPLLAGGFDAAGLVQQGTTRIIFTNGLNDGWSAGGFLTDVSPEAELLTLNMQNGAHHSDLSHLPPGPQDTPDVVAARAKATGILARWLDAAHVPTNASARRDPHCTDYCIVNTHDSRCVPSCGGEFEPCCEAQNQTMCAKSPACAQCCSWVDGA